MAFRIDIDQENGSTELVNEVLMEAIGALLSRNIGIARQSSGVFVTVGNSRDRPDDDEGNYIVILDAAEGTVSIETLDSEDAAGLTHGDLVTTDATLN